MILVIDNYDSFTYNLVESLRRLQAPVKVVMNDELSIEQVKSSQEISGFIISPGPGAPADAKLSCEIVAHFYDKKPIFGVCLGHQVICEYFGARVSAASRVMHGKISEIDHDGLGIFKDLPQKFKANRYHSLIADNDQWPEALEVSGWTHFNGIREIMGVRHKEFPVEGVQFHPESVLTPQGDLLFENFLKKINLS